MIKLKCIKTLYESTYKSNAFTRNKLYEAKGHSNVFVYVLDVKEKEFSFLKSNFRLPPDFKYATVYRIEDYFDLNPVNIRLVLIEKINNNKFNFKEINSTE